MKYRESNYEGRDYREFDVENYTYREYKIDLPIAEYIRDLRLGLNGHLKHTLRALAIAITGDEDQITGQNLVRAASYTLGIDIEWPISDMYTKIAVVSDGTTLESRLDGARYPTDEELEEMHTKEASK